MTKHGLPVTIAVCTYRRHSLFETLRSFTLLNDLDKYDLRILIIDNDADDSLKATIETFSKGYPFKLRYVHAPKQNISIARNAALNNVETKWLLFIDDDEEADVWWLDNIMTSRQGSNVVIGQCKAIYGKELPKWLRRCDFHSNRLEGGFENAYTSNALLDMDFIKKHKLEFRNSLGKTGGEDTIFFRQIHELGGKISYCPEAIVYEPVPLNRASMKWVKTRKFRAGQIHGLLCKDFKPSAYKALLLTAGAKAIFSGLAAFLTIPGTDSSKRWWARAHLHAGAVNYRLKENIFEEYS